MTAFFWSNLSWFVLAGILVTFSLLVVAWKLWRSLQNQGKGPIIWEGEVKSGSKKPAPELVDLSKMAEVLAKVEEYRAAYEKIATFLKDIEKRD